MNNYHKNARTTVFSRELIVKRVRQEGGKGVGGGQAAWVSRQTVYKWLTRHQQGGATALQNASSRPRTSPGRMPVQRVATIAAMRRAVFEYIEVDYNRNRRHSANGYISPLAFENQIVA